MKESRRESEQTIGLAWERSKGDFGSSADDLSDDDRTAFVTDHIMVFCPSICSNWSAVTSSEWRRTHPAGRQ